MKISVRPHVLKAILQSLPATIFWLAVAWGVYWIIPQRAWHLKYYGMVVSLGIIGLWRYSWLFLNILRAYYYGYFVYPRIVADCANADYPKQICFIVLSYHETEDITELCFGTLTEQCQNLPSRVTILASIGSEAEAEVVRRTVDAADRNRKINLLFTIQSEGKRKAMAHALRVAQQKLQPLDENDVVVLMDGDTAVCEGLPARVFPLFTRYATLGATTVNNVAVISTTSSAALQNYFDLKLARRHHMMMSQSLCYRLLTLTGRFSVFRANVALTADFIEHLEADKIDNWLHGRIDFLMGDDKSTMFALLKHGWDMLYVPDAYVACLENRQDGFLPLVTTLMHRWYGNMLRTNGRAIGLGVQNVPLYTWLAFLDQRVSMWTSLIGPTMAVLLSIFVNVYFLAFYIVWVILTRLVQLWTSAVVYGHVLKVSDLLMTVMEQFYGSAIKIYCMFNLHRQMWQKYKEPAQLIGSSKWKQTWEVRFLISLYSVWFIVLICLASKLLKLPDFWR